MGYPDQPWGQQGPGQGSSWPDQGQGQGQFGQPDIYQQDTQVSPGGFGQPGSFGQQPGSFGQQPGGFGQPDTGYAQPGAGFGQPGGVGQQGPMQPGAYQPPGFQGYSPMQGGYVGQKNNSQAVAALVCGLAQFVLWFAVLIPGFLAACAALILGVMSLKRIRLTGEGGQGMAIAGIVLGALGVFGGVIWILLFVAGAATSPG